MAEKQKAPRSPFEDPQPDLEWASMQEAPRTGYTTMRDVVRFSTSIGVFAAALVLGGLGSCSLSELYDGTTPPPSQCPSGMIAVPKNGDSPAFCIDATEVRSRDYARFQDAINAGTPIPSLPGKCDWNTDISPSGDVSATSDLPIVGIDWCDAHAYCAWAQKRLCGAIGADAGHLDPKRRDTTASQWYVACSQSGALPYPYGASYEGAACAYCSPETNCDLDSSSPTGTPMNVGSKPECVGGYPGIFDMSGNAAEWEDSCVEDPAADAGGATDECYPRGGSFLYPHSDVLIDCLRCQSCASVHKSRNNRSSSIGMRCCKDL